MSFEDFKGGNSLQSPHLARFDLSHEVQLPALQEGLSLYHILDVREVRRSQRFGTRGRGGVGYSASITWLSCGMRFLCLC
jgi:hypothetical protein